MFHVQQLNSPTLPIQLQVNMDFSLHCCYSMEISHMSQEVNKLQNAFTL